jgi:hypothetical protein
MAEKIRLKNGQEFELVPMGIDTRDTEKRRYFKIISILTYAELLTILSNSVNLESIDYILEDGTTSKTFLDCVSLKGLEFKIGYIIDDTTTKDIFIIEVSTDAVEKTLQVIQKDNQITADALEELIFLVLEV